MAVNEFNHRPGNGDAVIGAGAPPNFIQYQQAAFAGVV
jgi:hypothetical protein